MPGILERMQPFLRSGFLEAQSLLAGNSSIQAPGLGIAWRLLMRRLDWLPQPGIRIRTQLFVRSPSEPTPCLWAAILQPLASPAVAVLQRSIAELVRRS